MNYVQCCSILSVKCHPTSLYGMHKVRRLQCKRTILVSSNWVALMGLQQMRQVSERSCKDWRKCYLSPIIMESLSCDCILHSSTSEFMVTNEQVFLTMSKIPWTLGDEQPDLVNSVGDRGEVLVAVNKWSPSLQLLYTHKFTHTIHLCIYVNQFYIQYYVNVMASVLTWSASLCL